MRRPDLTLATEDHNTPTVNIDRPIADITSRTQIDTLRKVIGGGEFIGWFQTFVCFVIMVYYGAVLAWGVQ